MSKVRTRMVVVVVAALVVGGGTGVDVARAESPAQAPVAAQAGDQEASAEVKVAKGVENREPVEEGDTFPAGTTVWAWTRILNGEGEVKHVWKRDGKELWRATLDVRSKKWTTYSRRKLNKPGSYSVDVVGGPEDTVIGTVSFTIE
ncbi:MAG: DUF2914 domain-containing protein [Kofleriaceae bacterium]